MNKFHWFSQLDIIHKVFNTSFPRARKRFLLIINVLCVITIIVIITFKIFSKHLYLNNAPRSSDLYHYRNLSIIWTILCESYNNRMHLGAFPSIETLPSHIFSDLRLPVFWCVFNDYQILFSKYRFLIKSGIFI